MDQLVEFGKKYGKLIAVGVVSSVVTAAAIIAYQAYNDEEYVEGIGTTEDWAEDSELPAAPEEV